MKPHWLLLLTAGWLIVGGPLAGDSTKADKDKLQGTWTPAAIERNGKRAGPGDKDFDNFKGQQFVFTGNKLTFKIPGGLAGDATYRLDATKKPKTMDMTGVGSKSTTNAIYTFEGDTLIICRPEPDGRRPTEFKTTPGDKIVVYLLKREKP